MKTIFPSKILVLALVVACIPASFVRGDAAALWTANCASCHGKDGKGNTMMGRKLKLDDLTTLNVSDAQATDAIKNGITKNGNTMKAYGGKLSDADIKSLVAYLHTLK